jgi:hypothetical protein
MCAKEVSLIVTSRHVVPKGASHILGVEFAGTISDIGPAPEGENDDVPILRQAIGRFKQNDEVYGLAYGVSDSFFEASPLV